MMIAAGPAPRSATPYLAPTAASRLRALHAKLPTPMRVAKPSTRLLTLTASCRGKVVSEDTRGARFRNAISYHDCAGKLKHLIQSGWKPTEQHLLDIMKLPYKLDASAYAVIADALMRGGVRLQPSTVARLPEVRKTTVLQLTAICNLQLATPDVLEQIIQRLEFLVAEEMHGPLLASCMRYIKLLAAYNPYDDVIRQVLKVVRNDVEMFKAVCKALQDGGVDPALTYFHSGIPMMEFPPWAAERHIADRVDALDAVGAHPCVVRQDTDLHNEIIKRRLEAGPVDFCFRKRLHAVRLWHALHEE